MVATKSTPAGAAIKLGILDVRPSDFVGDNVTGCGNGDDCGDLKATDLLSKIIQ